MSDLTAGPAGSDLEQPSLRAHMKITTVTVVFPSREYAPTAGRLAQLGALLRSILVLLRPARKH